MEAASSKPNINEQQQQQRLPVPASAATIGTRSRSGRVVFSPRQLNVLEQRFRGQRFLSKEERQQLAIQLNLTDRQIMIWFQNRRGRLKRLGPADKVYTSSSSPVGYHGYQQHSLSHLQPHPHSTPMSTSLLNTSNQGDTNLMTQQRYFNRTGSASKTIGTVPQYFNNQYNHHVGSALYCDKNVVGTSSTGGTSAFLYNRTDRPTSMMSSPYYDNSVANIKTSVVDLGQNKVTRNAWCYDNDTMMFPTYAYSYSNSCKPGSNSEFFNDMESTRLSCASCMPVRSPLSMPLPSHVPQLSGCMYNNYQQRNQHYINYRPILHSSSQTFSSMAMPNYGLYDSLPQATISKFYSM